MSSHTVVIRGIFYSTFLILASGRNNLPEKVMAKAILEGVGKYLSSSRRTVLETIDIVVFKPEMVQSFEKAIQAAINEKSRGGKSMFAKISSLVSSWMKTGETLE